MISFFYQIPVYVYPLFQTKYMYVLELLRDNMKPSKS